MHTCAHICFCTFVYTHMHTHMKEDAQATGCCVQNAYTAVRSAGELVLFSRGPKSALRVCFFAWASLV